MEESIFIVIDIETTGIRPEMAEITEIGALKVKGDKILDTFDTLIDPGCTIPERITEITGITDEMVSGKPDIGLVMPQLAAFCGEHPMIGHNIMFDYSFLKTNASRVGIPFEKDGLDTLSLARAFLTNAESKSLGYLIKYLDIPRENAHRAFDDALATFKLYRHFVEHHLGDETVSYFKPRPLQYKPKKSAPMTARQASYLKALVDRYKIVLDKPMAALSKSEASRLIDKILSQHGRPQ